MRKNKFGPKIKDVPRGYSLVDKEFNALGCFRLVRECIYHAVHLTKTEQNKAINRRFAKESPLIQIFCDIAEIDERRVRDKILENNKSAWDSNLPYPMSGRPKGRPFID